MPSNIFNLVRKRKAMAFAIFVINLIYIGGILFGSSEHFAAILASV